MNLKRTRVRGVALRASVLAAALLAACGGGTQVTPFVPTRALAFGDETSVINADGSKYTVNAVQADLVTLDCKLNPTWAQALAAAYGLVFPQCNPDAVAAPASRIYAAAGAGVAAVATQIDMHLQNGGAFNSKDLVTVFTGWNDILALYALYGTTVAGVLQTEDVLIANAEALGTDLAAQVNRIANAGGKVLISTVPELGLTPFAIAEKAAHTDTDRAALLTRLTARFNAKLRLNITNDGTKIGLLLTDEYFRAVSSNPTASGYANVTAAACGAVELPLCTTQDVALVVDPVTNVAASGDTWLWADDRHLSPGGQRALGQLAATRAAGNPF